MTHPAPDHYAVLGVGRKCTAEEIRIAYRLLARKFHPDLNPGDEDALRRSQDINAANDVLSDPRRRREYDRERDEQSRPEERSARSGRIERNLTQDVRLRVEEFIRGTSLEIRVNDPANPDGPECYPVDVPADTVPRSRIRVPREGAMTGGVIVARLMVLPGRFKAAGSDLKTDLRISAQRAAQGGTEAMSGATGGMIRVTIPAGVGRGAVVRVAGEGLPKPHGGRGDLHVKITYRPEVKVTRR